MKIKNSNFNVTGSQTKTSGGSDLVTELLNRGNKLREAMILSTLKERSPLDDSADIHLPQVSSSDPVFSKARYVCCTFTRYPYWIILTPKPS